MAWIKLAFVALCISSIHGLDQDIANPSEDSKPNDLTKNPIENPSLGDLILEPSDLTKNPMKKALEFIWNQANYRTGFWPRQEVSAAILGNYLNITFFETSFSCGFEFAYFFFNYKIKSLSFNVIQKSMKVTRRIVLPLLTKALY